MKPNNEGSSGSSNSSVGDNKDQCLKDSPSYHENDPYTSYKGDKPTWQGPDYQLKLLMLFAWKAMKDKNYEAGFQLATEMRDSDWDVFDDLVLRYTKDGKKHYRYLQAKHNYLGYKKIKLAQLKSDDNNDFSLLKYFKAYLIINKKLEPNEHLKDVIICTNIGFDFDDFKGDKERQKWKEFLVEKDDPILNVGGKIYQFEKSKIQEVKKELETKFQNALNENKETSKGRSGVKEEKKEKSKGRSGVKEEKKEKSKGGSGVKEEKKEKSKGTSEVIEKNKQYETSFLDYLSELNKPTLLNECLDKIEDFLDKLVFAVEQPSGAKLDEIIKDEIGAEFDLINSWTYDAFRTHMDKWMKEYIPGEGNKNQAYFLPHSDLKKFFDDAKREIASLGMVGSKLLYEGKIDEYGIQFKDDMEETENIKQFLNKSDHKLLMIYQNKTLLTGIKVCQILKSKTYKHDEYIFLDLKSLSILKDSQADPIKTFESLSRNLVIIEYNTKEEVSTLKSFLEVLKGNNEKKIILIISNEEKADIEGIINVFFNWLVIDDKLKKIEDKSNKLTDLTDESQTMLLNKEGTVIFQGKEVSLATLIEDKKHLINGEVLFKVINDEKIEIGQKLEDQKYNKIKEFYIDRRFTKSVNRNRYIENEKSKSTVSHHKSDTSTSYIESKVRDLVSYEADSIEDKVVIIVDAPGMGKSTVLSHIALQKKESQPSLMILKVNLVNYSTEFKNLKKAEEELFKFLYKIFLNNNKEPESKLQENLNLGSLKINIKDNIKLSCTKSEECKLDDVSWFKIQLFNEYYNQAKIFFMFDGYDEISPHYKDIVMELFKVLKHSGAKMLITTRPYNISEELENELGVSSYTLQPFSEDDKKEYLKKFWGFDDEGSDRFVKRFVEYLSYSNDLRYMRDFLNNPLQLHMLASVLKDKVKVWYNSDKEMIKKESYNDEHILNDKYKIIIDGEYEKWNLGDKCSLYKEFVEFKFFEIDIKDKNPEYNTDKPSVHTNVQTLYKIFLKDHKKLAAYSLLDECEVRLFLRERELKDISEIIKKIEGAEEKTGMITHVADNKPVFIHRTFAEYFLALLIYDELDSGADNTVCMFLLQEILMDIKYSVVRLFLNDLLKKYMNENTSENIMKALKTMFTYYSTLSDVLITIKDPTKTMEELKENVQYVQENHPNLLKNIPTSIKSRVEWMIKFNIRDESKLAVYIEILDSLMVNKPNWLEYILDDNKRGIMTEICDLIYHQFRYVDSPLHVAIKERLDVVVEFLLVKHPEQIIKSYQQVRKDFINYPKDWKRTALDHAVKYGNESIVELLISKHALISPATINYSNEQNYKILLKYFHKDNVIVPPWYKSEYKREEILKECNVSITEVNEQIEKHGVNGSNHEDNSMEYCDGDTLLHKAIRNHHYKLAKFLINNVADGNIENIPKETALLFVTIKIGYLMESFPFLYDCSDCNPPPSSEDLVDESPIREPSPLMSTIQYISGQQFASKEIKQLAQICKLLLDKGADENELRNSESYFIRAVIKESLDRLPARIELTPSHVPLICMECNTEFHLTK